MATKISSETADDIFTMTRGQVRSTIAASIRDAKIQMKNNYGSGKDNARLSGAEIALYEFAERWYYSVYGDYRSVEDWNVFLKECGL